MASDDKLLQDEVGLVEIEYQIKLTHVAEVPVKDLHEVVDHV